VLVTAGLSTLVYAITKASDYGWTSLGTIGLFAASLTLLASFVAVENRVSDPLMPLSIFRVRAVAGANVAGFILGAAVFGMFVMLTLYMQLVLGYSPMRTGFAYLAVAGTAIIWANVAAVVVTRVGVKPVLGLGMTLVTISLVYFAQVSAGGSYVGDLLPGFLVLAAGMGLTFVPITIAGMAGVDDAQAGLASGLINTTQQIGGALGIAVMSAVATSVTSDSIVTGATQATALAEGFQAAFWVAAAVAFAGVVLPLALIRGDEIAAEPALEAA
jgi:hypothetical protein